MDRPCVGELIAELELTLNPLYQKAPTDSIGPWFAPMLVKDVIADLESRLTELQQIANEFGMGYIQPPPPETVYEE